jgi:hypothetical protein
MSEYDIKKYNELECELRIAEARIRKLEEQLRNAAVAHYVPQAQALAAEMAAES